MNRYERALRDAGLFAGLSSGPVAPGYRDWLDNARRREVLPARLVEIVRRHGITAESFSILERMEAVKDPRGKSFFLIPHATTGQDARRAVLMTYILNAGTDYGLVGGLVGGVVAGLVGGRAARVADFPETPYCAAEVQRIIERQHANSWSYDQDVGFVDRNGGRLVTTPNGMLMGLGGNRIQGMFSRQGGTAWGDIFMVNMGRRADPAALLRLIIASGHAWCSDRNGRPVECNLDLDRVLHHEELHCRQWATKGYRGMLRDYGWEIIRERVLGKTNRLEADAGLSDGGYR